MSKQQDLPHYGVKNGFTRKGSVVCIAPAQIGVNGEPVPAKFRNFPSVSEAKRFMRTGDL